MPPLDDVLGVPVLGPHRNPMQEIGGEACRDVQQCACGRGYLRAADGASFCTLADGVVVQMIRCTNNGRILLANPDSTGFSGDALSLS